MTLFLCIGFVQPHKGFERAVRALRAVESRDARLRVVGSVRIPWQPAIDYAANLHRECAEDARCGFVEQFVSPEEFDAWIVASDYVIVPYREIWSSGVAARAALHGRTVIAAEVGGLRDQLPAGTHFFKSDAELVSILDQLARAGGSVRGETAQLSVNL